MKTEYRATKIHTQDSQSNHRGHPPSVAGGSDFRQASVDRVTSRRLRATKLSLLLPEGTITITTLQPEAVTPQTLE